MNNENELKERKISSKFVNVCAGLNFSIALTNSGEVYIWGNFQISRENDLELLQILEKRKIKIPPFYNYSYFPFKIKMFDYKKPVKKISCGFQHIILIDEEFNAYGLGDNKKGQLGIGFSIEFQKSPFLINNSDDNIKYKKCFCYSDHSFLIDNENNLYGCGFNFKGVLGLGEFNFNKNIPVFMKVDIRNVVKLSTNFSHTLALCESKENKINWLNLIIDKKKSKGSRSYDRKLYVWGNNTDGELGLNDREIRPVPICMNTFVKFKDICAGINTSTAISINNNLYVWGLLNIFDFKNKKKNKKSLIPIQKELFYKNNSINLIKKIKIGDYFHYVITKNNNLYYWGDFRNEFENEIVYNTKMSCLKISRRKLLVSKASSSSSHFLLINQGSVYFMAKDNINGFEIAEKNNKKNNELVLYEDKNEIGIKKFRFLDYMIINDKENLNFQTNSNFFYSESRLSILKSCSTIKKSKSIFFDQIKFYSKNELNLIFQNLSKQYSLIMQKENKIKKQEIIKKEKIRQLKFLIINRLHQEPFKKLELFKKDKLKKNDNYEFLINENIYRKLFKGLYMHPCYLKQLIKTNKEENEIKPKKLIKLIIKIIGYNFLAHKIRYLFLFSIILQCEMKKTEIIEEINFLSKKKKKLEYSVCLLKTIVRNDGKLVNKNISIFKKIKEKMKILCKNNINYGYPFLYNLNAELKKCYKNDNEYWKLNDFNERVGNLLAIINVFFENVLIEFSKNICDELISYIILMLNENLVDKENFSNNSNHIKSVKYFIFFLPLFDILNKKIKNKNTNFENYIPIKEFIYNFICNKTFKVEDNPWVVVLNDFIKDNNSQLCFQIEKYISQNSELKYENEEIPKNLNQTKNDIKEIKSNLLIENNFEDVNKKKIHDKKNFNISQISFLERKSYLSLKTKNINLKESEIKSLTILINKIKKKKKLFSNFINQLDPDYNYLKKEIEQKNEKKNEIKKNVKIKINLELEGIIKKCTKCGIFCDSIFIDKNEHVVNKYKDHKEKGGIYYYIKFIDTIFETDYFNDYYLSKKNLDLKHLEDFLISLENKKNKKMENALRAFVEYLKLKKKFHDNNKTISQLILGGTQNIDFFYLNHIENILNKFKNEILLRQEYFENLNQLIYVFDYYNFFLDKNSQKLEFFLENKNFHLFFENQKKIFYHLLETNINIGFANFPNLEMFFKKKKFVTELINSFIFKKINLKLFQKLSLNEKSEISQIFYSPLLFLIKQKILLKFEKISDNSFLKIKDNDIIISFHFDTQKNFILNIYDISLNNFFLEKSFVIDINKFFDLYQEIDENQFVLDFLVFDRIRFLELSREIFFNQNHYQLLSYIVNYKN